MSLLHNKRSKAYALLLLNAALWGFIPPIAKETFKSLPPEQILFGRFFLASIIFLPIYLLFFATPTHSKTANLKTLLPQALLSTPLCLLPLYFGLQYTSALEASILVATGPIITIISGLLFLKEKISRQKIIGITITISGTLLLILKPLIIDGPTMTISLFGNFLIILSNLVWTTFILLQRKHPTDSAKLSLISYLVSIPFFLGLTLLHSPSTAIFTPLLSPTVIPALLYLAVFGSIVAFWAHATAQNIITASDAAVFSYLQPIFTLPLSLFWLHETVSPITFLSLTLIAIGVYISEFRPQMV